jgi:hypothetical protein
VTASCETIRRWVNHFGPMVALELRKRRPKPHSIWHLDEVYGMARPSFRRCKLAGGSKLERLATANPFSDRNRHRCLMDIQPREDDIIRQARLPCLRLGVSQPGATLNWDTPPDGSPAFSADEHRV